MRQRAGQRQRGQQDAFPHSRPPRRIGVPQELPHDQDAPETQKIVLPRLYGDKDHGGTQRVRERD